MIQNIIATESNAAAGAIVLWSLAGEVALDDLVAEWTARGGAQDDLPNAPTALRVLRRACVAVAGKRLVRPIREGFALVDEREDEATTLDFEIAARARLHGGALTVDGADWVLGDALRAEYQRAIGRLEANEISGWLVREMDRVDAVGLRERGGVYFVPPSGLARIRKIADTLADVSRCRLYEIPAMRSDSAVEAILAAVEAEASEAVRGLQEDIETQRWKTERGWVARTRDLDDVEAKMARYEGLLGTKITSLAARLASVRAGLAAAALAAASDDSDSSNDFAALPALPLV
jgi:hypothetical protein